ncbi:MAG: AEC family transporter [Oscillospiraceae bacterium]|nr:AEC family transporter [Oscillospiraceae bacterium]
MQALTLSAELILILLVGLFAQKLHVIGPAFNKQVSAFVLNIALPCMIINSMNVPDAMNKLIQNAWILAISVAVLVLGFLVGLLMGKLLKKHIAERIIRFGATFTNFNFFGVVVVEKLGGDELLFYYLIFIIPVRLTIYLLAKIILMPKENRAAKMTLKEKLKMVLSAPLVAVFIGLALSFFKVRVPVVIQYGLDQLGVLASPLGILLCGSTLGCYSVKKMVTKSSVIMSLIRNFLMPLIVWLLCRGLRLPEMYTSLAVIYSALPVASLTSTYVLQYDPDPKAHLDGAGFVFVSTLLSAASLSIFALLL